MVQGAYSGPPKIVIAGGNGFVGTTVCQEALKTGLSVVSISRGGRPPVQVGLVLSLQYSKQHCADSRGACLDA